MTAICNLGTYRIMMNNKPVSKKVGTGRQTSLKAHLQCDSMETALYLFHFMQMIDTASIQGSVNDKLNIILARSGVKTCEDRSIQSGR